jgi:hypothetical protein
MSYCTVSKDGSELDKALRKQYYQDDFWTKVIESMSVHLGEKINRIYTRTALGFPIDVIDGFNDERKKMFRKDGFLKSTPKGCKILQKFYESLLDKWHLNDYQSISDIRFTFGMFRFHGESSEAYRDFEGRLYSKTSFDQTNRTSKANENLTPIS